MPEFIVVGPIEMKTYNPKLGGKSLTDKISTDAAFWNEAEKQSKRYGIKNIKDAAGCYIFGMRAGRGIMPYYVGKTNRQTLSTEPFTDPKIVNYNKVVGNIKGTPVMFFTVIKGKNNAKAISELEKYLIGRAFEKNPSKLLNKVHAKKPNWSIRGVVRTEGKGKATQSSTAFKNMFSFD